MKPHTPICGLQELALPHRPLQTRTWGWPCEHMEIYRLIESSQLLWALFARTCPTQPAARITYLLTGFLWKAGHVLAARAGSSWTVSSLLSRVLPVGGRQLCSSTKLLKASAVWLEGAGLTEHWDGPGAFAVRNCVCAGRSHEKAISPGWEPA